MNEPLVVLVVDDDQAVLEAMQLLLEGEDYRVLRAMGSLGAEALLCGDQHIDIVVADVILAGEITGIDVCHRARQVHADVATVIISADPNTAHEAIPVGSVYLRKPFGGRELLAAMQQARAACVVSTTR